MEAPDKVMDVFAAPNQNQTHQRRLPKVKAALPISSQERLQLLLLLHCRQLAPVLLLHGHSHGAVDNLKRLIRFLPKERRAQDAVPVNDALPGLLEHLDIDSAGQRAVELLEIDPRLRGIQAVKQ